MVEKHYILLEFESLSQPTKNIFFVAFIHKSGLFMQAGFIIGVFRRENKPPGFTVVRQKSFSGENQAVMRAPMRKSY